jgi:hypothetical protein
MIGGTDPVQAVRDVCFEYQTLAGGRRPKRLLVSPQVAYRFEKLAGEVPQVRRVSSGSALELPVIAVLNVPLVVDPALPAAAVWADGEDPGCG